MGAPLELTFVMSAADVQQLPGSRAEVAFIGRSNVGKSSLLNALAGRKSLAKVSSKPGRTQLLNLFATADGAGVLDLPGFGYASTASATTRQEWRKRMELYLLRRPSLVLTFLLVDAEIGPAKLDVEMLSWLRKNHLPFQLVATKYDKVKASKRDRRKRDLAEGCAIDPAEILWVSAAKGTGLDQLRDLIRLQLGMGAP
jgi:GTP-binding protein